MANTKRENRIEELGRVDAEHAETSKGKKNLRAEKRRIRKELKAKTGTIVKAKQGYYDREDESIGMRLGKGKATKKDKKKAKAERDESYGDWGKRSKDWKTKKAKTGSMIKAKRGKRILRAAAAAGAAYLASKHLGKPGYKNVHETGAISKTPGRWKNVKYPKGIHPGTAGTRFQAPITEKKGDIYPEIWGGAKTGKMIKAKGSVFVKTRIGRNKRTLTF
jgi:hypothetical protein